MKSKNRIISFLLMFIVLFAIGCASTSSQEGTGEYFDDSIITTKVKAEIFNDPVLKSNEINVETYKGIVQLSGFVSNRDSIQRAVSLARRVKGVKAVNADMRVK